MKNLIEFIDYCLSFFRTHRIIPKRGKRRNFPVNITRNEGFSLIIVINFNGFSKRIVKGIRKSNAIQLELHPFPIKINVVHCCLDVERRDTITPYLVNEHLPSRASTMYYIYSYNSRPPLHHATSNDLDAILAKGIRSAILLRLLANYLS